MLAHPPDDKFRQLIGSKILNNCLLAVNNVTNDRIMFGPNLPSLGGKTARKNPVGVEQGDVGIPKILYESHRCVILCADVIFVNGTA